MKVCTPKNYPTGDRTTLPVTLRKQHEAGTPLAHKPQRVTFVRGRHSRTFCVTCDSNHSCSPAVSHQAVLPAWILNRHFNSQSFPRGSRNGLPGRSPMRWRRRDRLSLPHTQSVHLRNFADLRELCKYYMDNRIRPYPIPNEYMG